MAFNRLQSNFYKLSPAALIMNTHRYTNIECKQPYPAHKHRVRPSVLFYHKELVPDPASLGALQHLALFALLMVAMEGGPQVVSSLQGQRLAVVEHAQAHQGSL